MTTKESAAKLLPCWHCGRTPEIKKYVEEGGHFYGIVCPPDSSCFGTHIYTHFDPNNCSIEQAIDWWNRRALPDADGWQPIETAPKDGTTILAWCVHINAKYSQDPIKEGWECPVIASWTGFNGGADFNGGGWTWHGLAGTFTKWHPLPKPPETQR